MVAETSLSAAEGVSSPSFAILREAVLETWYDVMNDDFEPVEEQASMRYIIDKVIKPGLMAAAAAIPSTTTIVSPNTQRIILGAGMEWIKVACGTFTIGMETQDDNHKTLMTKTFQFFGGTDGDRKYAGDAVFWDKVQEKAPSITAAQWTEFVGSGQVPGLDVSVTEEDEDDNDDDDDDDDDDEDGGPPHAAYPDVAHSVLLLTLAEELFGCAVGQSEDSSLWTYEGPSNSIPHDSETLEGHSWIRRNADKAPSPKAKDANSNDAVSGKRELKGKEDIVDKDNASNKKAKQDS